jgi:hypothetical protein
MTDFIQTTSPRLVGFHTAVDAEDEGRNQRERDHQAQSDISRADRAEGNGEEITDPANQVCHLYFTSFVL